MRVPGGTPGSAGTEAAAAAPVGAAPATNGDGPPSGERIITTDTEMRVFEYVRRRLPFLMDRDEALYAKLEHLYPRDYKTRFTVCYKQDRSGRLFNFVEMAQGPKYRFEFPDSGTVLNTDSIGDIDAELLDAFLRRVTELG